MDSSNPTTGLRQFLTIIVSWRGGDPSVFLSHLSGRDGALSVPWITAGWLDRLEQQFAHVRSKFLRLGYNVWSTSDTGAFLTEEEITDGRGAGPARSPVWGQRRQAIRTRQPHKYRKTRHP
jgi:hypothetical protein